MTKKDLQNFFRDCAPETFVEVGVGIVLGVDPHKDRSPGEFRQVLITRRAAGTVYGGYWEFPGGKCADGESPEACVVRELAEEVGVAAEVFGLLSGVIHTYPHGTVRLHPRLCRLTAGSGPPRNLQVAEHRWVSIEGLGAFRFPEANEAILRELRAWVGGRSGA